MHLDHVFVCGDPALDFAATLRARRSARFEMFVTPDRLDAWYRESGVVDTIVPGGGSDVEQATAVREPSTSWSRTVASVRNSTGRRSMR